MGIALADDAIACLPDFLSQIYNKIKNRLKTEQLIGYIESRSR